MKSIYSLFALLFFFVCCVPHKTGLRFKITPSSVVRLRLTPPVDATWVPGQIKDGVFVWYSGISDLVLDLSGSLEGTPIEALLKCPNSNSKSGTVEINGNVIAVLFDFNM